MEAEYTRSYNSFSGVDIQATFAGNHVGELQGISYTVTREKAPVYAMGSANPLGFSRGKRGIAGSLIFVVMNRSNLLESLGEDSYFWASDRDMFWGRSNSVDISPGSTEALGATDATAIGRYNVHPSTEDVNYRKVPAWYHDQIPPFNIVLTAMTEYGVAARMAIIGVEILNAGSGISIDDITTDENMTFVARTVVPWRFLGAAAPDGFAVPGWTNVGTYTSISAASV